MNLSDISSIATIIVTIITACIWLWKLTSRLKKYNSEAELHAAEGERVAQQLLNSATSPTKRADIHLYIMLRATELSTNQLKRLVVSYGVGILILSITIPSMVSIIALGRDQPIVLSIIFYLCILTMVISYLIALWFSYNLRKLEKGWETGVMTAIHEKLVKHVPDI